MRPYILAAMFMLTGAVATDSAFAGQTKEASERKTVEVAPNVLDTYAGQYELAPKVMLILRRVRQRLTAQISGQPAYVVFPESETTFSHHREAEAGLLKISADEVIAAARHLLGGGHA